MKDIKFRGMDLNNKKWAYGFLVYKEDQNGNRECFIIESFKENLILTNIDCINVYKVLPASVGQYTGFKDKNGNEIFEDDILRGIYNHMKPYEIYWGDSTGSFENLWECGNSEIIGNKTENPDLLKE